jgi:hypothetical protein
LQIDLLPNDLFPRKSLYSSSKGTKVYLSDGGEAKNSNSSKLEESNLSRTLKERRFCCGCGCDGGCLEGDELSLRVRVSCLNRGLPADGVEEDEVAGVIKTSVIQKT